MPANKLIITPDTKIADLLAAYPQVETLLAERAPSFSALQNPVLRATVARSTALQQLAKASQIDVVALVSALRTAVGQDAVTACTVDSDLSVPFMEQTPPADARPTETIDAREMLAQGIHPKELIMEKAQALTADDCLLFITPFIPSPLIELLQSIGCHTNTVVRSEAEVHTWVTKS